MEMVMNKGIKMSKIMNKNPLKVMEKAFTYEPVFGLAIWATIAFVALG